MTHIRVDVEQLRLKADELESAAERMRGLADEVHAAAAGAPSYDGQLRPKALGLADEARSALVGRAQQLAELSAELRARADAFEEVDRQWHEALAGINQRSLYPLSDIQFGRSEQDGKPPWWLVELIIGMVPFGDLYDVVKELIRLITSGEWDTLVLILAALGLIADIGWADGPVPDPADGANAGLALLKGLVKQIPPGPARDAIQESLLRLVRNADEAPAFFATIHALIKHDEVLEVLKDNPRALAAILDAGPEAVELLGRNEEVALQLLRRGDDAAELLSNPRALELVLDHGPEAVNAVIAYGPEGIELVSKYGDMSVDVMVRHADDLSLDQVGQLLRFNTLDAGATDEIVGAIGGPLDGVRSIPDGLEGRAVVALGDLDATRAAETAGEEILNIDNWSLEKNFLWLEERVRRGDVVHLVSSVDGANLSHPYYKVSVYARELNLLLEAGYRRVGDYLVPPH